MAKDIPKHNIIIMFFRDSYKVTTTVLLERYSPHADLSVLRVLRCYNALKSAEILGFFCNTEVDPRCYTFFGVTRKSKPPMKGSDIFATQSPPNKLEDRQ